LKEQYLIRHVPVLISQMKQSGRKAKVNFESIRSIRRSYRSCTDEVKNKIEIILDKLQEDDY
jgi:hypothetical protein